MPDERRFTVHEMKQELHRQHAILTSMFEGHVARGKLTRDEADYRLGNIAAAIEVLETLQAAEPVFEQITVHADTPEEGQAVMALCKLHRIVEFRHA